jgi:hypothetical protein
MKSDINILKLAKINSTALLPPEIDQIILTIRIDTKILIVSYCLNNLSNLNLFSITSRSRRIRKPKELISMLPNWKLTA